VYISPTADQIIRLTITDENGCTAEADYQIRVAIIKDVWAPNVFSPNSDQVNDRFTIYGKPTLISIDKLQIYDRWGELLYEDYNLPPGDPNYGWDGTFRGTLLNPAVFVYVAHVRFVDGETRLLYGDVTLIR
jgi:gliding motility-associated-like protein